MSRPFQKSKDATVSYPAAPEGRTIYAVGDIHGRLDLLEKVFRDIDNDKKGIGSSQVAEIFLGDYIDRGPDSAGVISRLIDRGRRVETIFLRGNHEQLLLNFVEGGNRLEEWRALGGVPTMLSYRVEADFLAGDASDDEVRAEFIRRMPGDHQEFYATTSSYCDAKPYLFVHAGIRPGVKIDEQSITDLLTIRKGFLDFGKDFGRIVVHGHTPVMQPELHPNRINIDTGAFATHNLTCLKIDAEGARVLSG
jgi:serine/threonine protein phosphatase 1